MIYGVLVSADVLRDRRRRPGVRDLAGIRVQVSSHDDKQISPDLNNNQEIPMPRIWQMQSIL